MIAFQLRMNSGCTFPAKRSYLREIISLPYKLPAVVGVRLVAKRKPNSKLQEIEAISDDVSTLDHYPPISPVGDGSMPFSAAVHWIASEGLQFGLPLSSAGQKYHDAAISLRDKITSEKVRTSGENLDGDPEAIAAVEFEQLQITFDFYEGVEHIAGRVNRIEIVPSENGLSQDCYFKARSHRPFWTKVVVRKEDIFREWQFDSVPEESAYDMIPELPLRGRKAEAARQALLQSFPGRRVPKHLTTAQLVNQLNRREKRDGDLGGFERTTVLRALGRRR
jgi:hypothetical protein